MASLSCPKKPISQPVSWFLVHRHILPLPHVPMSIYPFRPHPPVIGMSILFLHHSEINYSPLKPPWKSKSLIFNPVNAGDVIFFFLFGTWEWMMEDPCAVDDYRQNMDAHTVCTFSCLRGTKKDIIILHRSF